MAVKKKKIDVPFKPRPKTMTYTVCRRPVVHNSIIYVVNSKGLLKKIYVRGLLS